MLQFRLTGDVATQQCINRPAPEQPILCAGMDAPIIFSLAYAAPEIVAAYHAGVKTVLADAAADMWALGVIAFELLTKQRVFTPTAGVQDVVQRLLGEKPLLWEGDSPATRAKLRELRGLKRAILSCLDRNPANRPTADALLQSWNHMFDATKTALYTHTSGSSV
jgi:serine/threonine protein kinase